MQLFGQVWLWSVLSFLLGVFFTWLLFVRPAAKRIDTLEAEARDHHDRDVIERVGVDVTENSEEITTIFGQPYQQLESTDRVTSRDVPAVERTMRVPPIPQTVSAREPGVVDGAVGGTYGIPDDARPGVDNGDEDWFEAEYLTHPVGGGQDNGQNNGQDNGRDTDQDDSSYRIGVDEHDVRPSPVEGPELEAVELFGEPYQPEMTHQDQERVVPRPTPFVRHTDDAGPVADRPRDTGARLFGNGVAASTEREVTEAELVGGSPDGFTSATDTSPGTAWVVEPGASEYAVTDADYYPGAGYESPVSAPDEYPSSDEFPAVAEFTRRLEVEEVAETGPADSGPQLDEERFHGYPDRYQPSADEVAASAASSPTQEYFQPRAEGRTRDGYEQTALQHLNGTSRRPGGEQDNQKRGLFDPLVPANESDNRT